MCKATGSPTPKYKWYSPSGTLITSFDNFFVKDGNLTIIEVDPSLKGKYKCVAYNEIVRTGETIGTVEATVEIVDVYGKVNWSFFFNCSVRDNSWRAWWQIGISDDLVLASKFL